MRDIRSQKIYAPRKIDQSSPKYEITCCTQMTVIMSNFIALGRPNDVGEKHYKFFYTLQYFGAKSDPLG